MALWKASVKFLLSVNELLFLSLTVEALQGKMCQNSLPPGGGGSVSAKISGGRVVHCQYIDTTRKAIDCATTLPLTVLYNETLQQILHPLLSKLSQRRQTYVVDPHFKEVTGGVEPWLMAHWKGRVRLPIRHN